MNLRKIKLFASLLVLLAYVSISAFGLFHIGHSNQMPMNKCPYTQGNFAVCENTIDHINDWQQFSNTTFTTIFVFSLAVLGIILFFFYNNDFFNQKPQLFYKWKLYFHNDKSQPYLRKIIRWLSLFENSPSLSCKV